MQTPLLKLFKFDFLHNFISDVVVFWVDHDAPIFGGVEPFVDFGVEFLEF